MTARCATPDELADHDRDHRKNWEPPAPTVGINAIEIAIIVKGLKNLEDAGALIEQYAKTVAAGARLDGISQACGSIIKAVDDEIGSSA